MNQQSVYLQSSRQKRAVIRKKNWEVAESGYSPPSIVVSSSELQTVRKTLTSRNKSREGQPRCLGERTTWCVFFQPLPWYYLISVFLPRCRALYLPLLNKSFLAALFFELFSFFSSFWIYQSFIASAAFFISMSSVNLLNTHVNTSCWHCVCAVNEAIQHSWSILLC